ncbi:MAG: T9SS type A sorting domain-containing protein [Chitinophagales bacterium]
MRIFSLFIIHVIILASVNALNAQVLNEKVLSELHYCEQGATYISNYPFEHDKYIVVLNSDCNNMPHNYTNVKSMVALLDENFDTTGWAYTSFENLWFSDYGDPVNNSFFIVASNTDVTIQDSLYVGNLAHHSNNLVNSYSSFKPSQCNFEASDYYSGPESNIVAVNYKQGNCSNYKEASITCIDYNYNIKWQYKYEGAKNDEIMSIKRLDNKNLLALGHSNTKFTNTNLFLLNLDSNGMYLEAYMLPDSINQSYANALEIDDDGNVYLAWNQNNQLYLSKLNADLEEQWEIPLNTYGLNNVVLKYSKIDNSLLLISNGIDPFTMEFEQLVHKIKVDGSIVWKRTFNERIADFLFKFDGSMLFYADDNASNHTKIIHFDSTFAYYPPIDSSFNPDSDSSDIDTTEMVGISDIGQKQAEVKIFPNPFSERFSIVSKDQKISSYSIYNLMGQVVLKEELNANNKSISFDKQVSGTYILQIELEDGNVKTEKIVYRN